MELIDIIKFTLALLFTTIIVIIFSAYLFYKIKNRNGLKDKPELPDEEVINSELPASHLVQDEENSTEGKAKILRFQVVNNRIETYRLVQSSSNSQQKYSA